MKLENLDPKQYIIIKGAKVNNLKNIDVAIPRNKLIVITGLSGSGKSSLAFDTLFAEGQRMYVESLSAYARQFLGRMEKPDVEYIRGVAPAIAVEQKRNSKNPRATVGTSTEIYDYFKLLFARIGITYSPISKQKVKKDNISDVVDYIHSFEDGQKFTILAPLQKNENRTLHEKLKIEFQKGFARIVANNNILFIEELLENENEIKALEGQEIFLLIDRNAVKKEDEDNQYRISDSIQTAFYEGLGNCTIDITAKERKSFSDKFELDGILFEEPSVQFFSFNNPYGACITCNGFGNVLALDPNLIIPNDHLSLYEGAVIPWQTAKMSEWQKDFIRKVTELDFPIHRSIEHLDEKELDLLWNGNKKKDIKGINDFFANIEKQSHKIQYRVLLSRYRGRVTCPDCRGTRLRKDAGYVKIKDKSIIDIALMPIQEVLKYINNLTLNKNEKKIADRILKEIHNRLDYLNRVGLGYLTLNRKMDTLSGGEYQRIKLATALGSALVGSMYILDEPTIGLHPRDTTKLVKVLKDLNALGNTVIIVEHEEEVMKAAHEIIDIGPEAGSGGGKLVFQGSIDFDNGTVKVKNKPEENSHTINYLLGKDEISVPKIRRKAKDFIKIEGASKHNLKNVDVNIPLGVFTVVTGVSGSGKSTLINEIVYPALKKHYTDYNGELGKFNQMSGSLQLLEDIEYIEQGGLTGSSRSNAITYTKTYDSIRKLFAKTPLAKQRGYEASHFSFNVANKGRCETCEGDGVIKVEMQFMADVYLTCESCKGKRFKKEVLEVKYKDKDIFEVLDLTIDDSIHFFEEDNKIVKSLEPLSEVGLGYVRLGQATNTLSGGEAQRLKLASFLDKRNRKKGNTLFIFDEPTTGLHFHDIKKLLYALNALIELGHSVLVIEHNLEVIKSADWIIDLGPDGGVNGGKICFSGVPEDLIKLENNFTAEYLKEKI